MIRRTETKVTMMTNGRVPMGTRLAASLHQRSVVEATVTYTMSSMAEMHVAESKAGVEIRSVMNKNNAMRGTVITMAPTMTSLTFPNTKASHEESQDVRGDVLHHQQVRPG
jgi:hypothetical protein